MTDHLTTPMTPTEWAFVQHLLAQGDRAAQWPRGATGPVNKRITTAPTRAIVRLLAQGGTLQHSQIMHAVTSQLRRANELIGDQISGDLDPALSTLFSADEWNDMSRSFYTLNGDPENYEPGHPPMTGWAWAWYYAEKIDRLSTVSLNHLAPDAAPDYPPEATPQTNREISDRERAIEQQVAALLELIVAGRSVADALAMAYSDGWNMGFTEGVQEARTHRR